MRKWFAAVTLFAGAMIFSGTARAYDQVYERVVPFSPGGTLHLENVNGSVDVRAWDRNEVEIHAVKSARRSAADLDLVSIETKSTPGRVDVSTKYPPDQGVDVTVEYQIHVPRRALLETIATVNGNVRVTDVDGSGQLRTVNGDVEVYDCAGGFSARSTNGSVHEELQRLGANALSLETMNGSVLLAIPASAGAQLDAQSLNGEIRTEKPVMMNGSFGHGSFRGKLGAGGAPLKIRTVNGAIQISIWKATV
jgi:DUF4097 and DUF4098 domain-containing protein YvlB